MVTVACVLKGGGPYNPEWVRRLYVGVDSNLGRFRFVCLTDSHKTHFRDLPGVDVIPLKHGWPGWWSKLELFRPDVFRPEDRILYLDLDTLIYGDLEEIAAYEGSFAMLSDFYRPQTVASGVMAWGGEDGYEVYERFLAGGARPQPGRSDPFYARVFGSGIARLQSLFPGQIFSLKAHCMKGPPRGARLICFHGRPRPNDPMAGWAHKAWSAL